MMREQCSLQPNYYGISCDAQDLQLAVQQLTTKSEAQFSEIKNEKWFNRVFNIVTFSNKNKIHVADQITSLAQAQSILIEILARLSDQDASISKMVMQAQSDIYILAQNSTYLQERLYLLEDKSYGIKENENLKNLNGQQKNILCGCLNEVSKLYAVPSDEQRLYANVLLSALASDAQVDNLEDALNDLEVSAKQKILSCIITYAYLYDHAMKSMEQKFLNDFIALFDLGQKTIKSLKQQAEDVYHLRGIDGCIDRYITDSVKITEATPFEIELSDALEDDTSDCESVEDDPNDKIDTSVAREPLELSGIISIEKRQVYENKIIHLTSTIIDCSSELEFRNCTIHYNENAESRIHLNNGASLAILSSTVICHGNGLDDCFFITAKSANTCKIDGSCFIDCVDFLTGDFNTFLFSDNECCDCCVKFLDIHTAGQGNAKVETNRFIFASEPTFEPITRLGENSRRIPVAWCISISGQNVLIDNCNISSVSSKDGTPCIYMDSVCFVRLTTYKETDAQIGFCTFTNVKNCIKGIPFIYNCVFRNCENVISCCDLVSCTILDNQFIDCCHVAQGLTQGSQIKNCQFYGGTQERYITTGYGASITIETCEFVNLRFKRSQYGGSGILEFKPLSKTKLKKNAGTKISRCIFNGVQLVSDNSKEAYLISVSEGQEPVKTPVVSVSECIFQNCATNNQTGTLIHQEMTYCGLMNRKAVFQVILVANCTGCDQVTGRHQYIPSTDFKLKQTDAEGNRFGSEILLEDISCEECLKIKADIFNGVNNNVKTE